MWVVGGVDAVGAVNGQTFVFHYVVERIVSVCAGGKVQISDYTSENELKNLQLMN